MNPELEALLKSYDSFKQAPEGTEANRLYGFFQEKLEGAAQKARTSKETLQNAIQKLHPRWDFPSNLASTNPIVFNGTFVSFNR